MRHATRALLGMVLLGATGCMATDPSQWIGADESRFKRDRYDCQVDVNAVTQYSASFGGAIVPLVALASRRGHFRECMESRGWREAR